MSNIKINAATIKSMVSEWRIALTSYNSAEDKAQGMITRVVRLQGADRHISVWAGEIANQSINDEERNRTLTTFRGQLKRGAEGNKGERGTKARVKLDKYPTVKFSDKSYCAKWLDWPEDDEIKKQIRKELNAYLKDTKPEQLTALLSSLADFSKVAVTGMLADQAKLVEAEQLRIDEAIQSGDQITNALSMVKDGGALEDTAPLVAVVQ
jgi:hypothetical protein